MRTGLALAGVFAGAAAFLAPAAPASAYCQEPIIVLDDGSGGGGQQCTNSCYDTGRAYEELRAQLPYGDKLPGYWDLFACLD